MPSDLGWKRRIASYIIIVAGAFWIFFGFVELFLGPSSPAGVIEGLMLGGLVMMTLIVAYKRPGFGGSLLLIEGLLPFLATMSWSQSPIVFLVLGLPPVISGSLFIAQWFEDRSSKDYFWD